MILKALHQAREQTFTRGVFSKGGRIGQWVEMKKGREKENHMEVKEEGEKVKEKEKREKKNKKKGKK